MYLAAIYIKDHFLFEEPQTINFGGRYIYDFTNILGVTRNKNNRYVEGLYSADNLELVSAIVGENGAGKTSLLKEIVNIIQGKGYGVQYLAFIEDGNQTYTINNGVGFGASFVERSLPISCETLYYSPFLDFKEPISGIDLSYDTILANDLEIIQDIYMANNVVEPSRWLKSQNSLRQLEFQHSKYHNELSSFFSFPSFNKSKISFTRHKIDVDYKSDKIKFHNTPFDLQFAIQPLYKLIRNEADKINKNRPRDQGMVDLQKTLFKNYLIMDILCLFIKQMEKTNQYLQEGHIKNGSDNYEKAIKKMTSKDALFLFLDLHYYSMGKDKEKVLPVDQTKVFIDYLFETIDGLEAENDNDTRNFNWHEKSIYLDKDKTKEVIEYHRDFLIQVDKYYGGIEKKSGEILFEKSERIDGIVNFEPSEGSLSSGENALLNFYSRIYDYFKKNLINIPSVKKNDFYILLLDEADLGYHPKWKKLFIKSIVTFLPQFFKSFDSNIQIIFSTHDPLTLSDLPNNQIIYLNKIGETNTVLNEKDKPQKSFGANITDLLADSFFIEGGLIGDFAREKIKETIDWLNNDDRNISEKDYHRKLVNIVDEPLLKFKLDEMYLEIFPEDLDKEKIKKQIENLAKRSGIDVNFVEE